MEAAGVEGDAPAGSIESKRSREINPEAIVNPTRSSRFPSKYTPRREQSQKIVPRIEICARRANPASAKRLETAACYSRPVWIRYLCSRTAAGQPPGTGGLSTYHYDRAEPSTQ